MTPRTVWAERGRREPEANVRVESENGSGDGGNEEWPESVHDVDAVFPKMGLANKRRGEPHPSLPTDGEGGVIVWVNVVFE